MEPEEVGDRDRRRDVKKNRRFGKGHRHTADDHVADHPSAKGRKKSGDKNTEKI